MVKYILTMLILLFSSNCFADTLVFVAKWCHNCKEVKINAKELQDEGYDIKIIDCDQNKELVKKYKIRSIPTIIVVSGNSEIARTQKARSKEQIIKFIEKNTCVKDSQLPDITNYTGVIHFYRGSGRIVITNGYIRIGTNNCEAWVKKFKINRTPTIIVLKGGKETNRYEGRR